MSTFAWIMVGILIVVLGIPLALWIFCKLNPLPEWYGLHGEKYKEWKKNKQHQHGKV